MLKIHFLNVDHGDSIILEYKREDNGEVVFGLIDSNIRKKGEQPPALNKLKELGAEKLSFVALTHPHKDHFLGLSEIIEEYQNKIQTFYSFPLNSHLPGRLKKIASVYQELSNNTDGPYLRETTKEFVRLLVFIKRYIGIENWEEPTGCNNTIAPIGFNDVSLSVCLPHPKSKGPYFQMIESGDFDIVSNSKLNSVSMAFCINYKNHTIILGGDATRECWLDHEKFNKRRGFSFGGNIVKLPHHGSMYDCNQETIDYIFSDEESDPFAIISANGKSHPHPEVLQNLTALEAQPFCTNLAKQCGANIKKIINDQEFSSEFNRQLYYITDSSSIEKTQPCQGDIEITISENGDLATRTQYEVFCPYRNNIDSLLEEQ